MKKIIVLMLISIMLLASLIGCRPQNMTKEVYELGMRVLALTDKYIDGDIKRDVIYSEIVIVEDKLELIYKQQDSDGLISNKDWIKSVQTLIVSTGVSNIATVIMLDMGMDDLIRNRNTLARRLGEADKQ